MAPQLRQPAPPELAPDKNKYSTAGDPRYRDIDPSLLPTTECLRDVVNSVLPYWASAIVPDLRETAERGGAVMVAAHGNSIRALIKHLEGISDESAITELEVPTGIPYRLLLNDDLTVHTSEFLGDPRGGGRSWGRRRGPSSRLATSSVATRGAASST